MNIIKFATKLQATAEMMHADLGILGAKLPLMNKRKTNKRLDLIATANYESLDIKTNAEEEKMRNQKIEQISLLDHTSMEIDHPRVKGILTKDV